MALVEGARARRDERPFLDAFLQEFGLSNQEGIALMCIAEALLRIPDDATADRLIAEKLATGDWSAHAGKSESLFVNASTLGADAHRRHSRAGSFASKQTRPDGCASSRAKPASPGAPGRASRDAHHRRRIRSRPHHRGSIGAQRARGRSWGLCSFDMLGEGARELQQDAAAAT